MLLAGQLSHHQLFVEAGLFGTFVSRELARGEGLLADFFVGFVDLFGLFSVDRSFLDTRFRIFAMRFRIFAASAK